MLQFKMIIICITKKIVDLLFVSKLLISPHHTHLFTYSHIYLSLNILHVLRNLCNLEDV